MDLLNKYRGALIGLAIGDALGVPVEFKKKGTFEPVIDYRDCHHFPLPAGHWSDDTAMALCLAQSFIEKKTFDAEDQIEKYKQWLENGYCSSTGEAIGIGQTVLRALLTYKKKEGAYVSVTSIRSDGNGSLMRIAPVPLFYRKMPDQAYEKAELSSRVTHGSQLCSDACKFYTGLIIGALNGASKEKLLTESYSPIPNYWKNVHVESEIKEIMTGSYKQKIPPEIRGTGYVVKTLEASLWAFYNSNSFEEGVLMAVNLGDDADTTGAVFGQLAGAYYGFDAIPEKYVRNLAKGDEIIDVADKLFNMTV
jgi:ADP-ribosylglycohydrolase